MINENLSQKGSMHASILITLVLVLVGVLGFVFWQNFINKEPITKEAEVVKTNDDYSGWKTYAYLSQDYSIKYPQDWILIRETSNDGPYIRNFDPTSKPAEDSANNKNYPKDYINLRVIKIEGNDGVFNGSTASEWYAKLGVSEAIGAAPGFTHDPSDVSNTTINNMPAKKTKTVFTETNEDIFILKDNGSLYQINLYPYGASDNVVVKKMLDSFTFIDGKKIMVNAIQD